MQRALEHLNDLQLACNNWIGIHGNAPCSVVADPDAPGYILLKASVDPVPQKPFSLLIGDVVQNMRNALDHLAFSLAQAHTGRLSEKDTRNSQFPIIGDESSKGIAGGGAANFRDNALPRLIDKVSPKAQTIIEGLQPFKLGAKFRQHQLWRLNELANCDKHRFIHVAIASSNAALLNPAAFRNCVLGGGTMEIFDTLMDGETVIAKIPARPIDSNSQMHVDVRPSLAMAFSEGICAKKEVLKELSEIYQYVIGIVLPILTALI